MPAYNHVTLLGNLTRDPELKYIPSGTAVCDIGLAINERVKKGEQWVDEPCFVDVTCFGRTAEVCNEYCQKGTPLLIEGRLKFEQWEKDGQKRTKLKVIADKLVLLGQGTGQRQEASQKPQAGQSQGQRRQSQPPNRSEYEEPAGVPDGDDVPF